MNNLNRILVFFVLAILVVLPFSSCESNSGGSDRLESGSGYPLPPEAIRNNEFEMTDGKTFKLADQKGKVILINLWATWCGPCRYEMPELVKLQDEYREDGFEVIGLDVDPEPMELIEPFAKKMGLNYKLGWAEEEMVMEFFRLNGGWNGIPQTFLFNRNGEVVGAFRGGGESVISKMKETVAKTVEAK